MIVSVNYFEANFIIEGEKYSLSFGEPNREVCPLTIGTLLSAGSTTYNSAIQKLIEMQIEVNNVVTLNAVPVRVNTTGYLYDIISDNLIGNSGNDYFILGFDKNANSVVATRINFGFTSSNIEANGTITNYPNMLSCIVPINRFNHIKVEPDSNYNILIIGYYNTTFITKTFIEITAGGEPVELDIPSNINAIRVLCYDRPSLSYMRYQSDFKIILSK